MVHRSSVFIDGSEAAPFKLLEDMSLKDQAEHQLVVIMLPISIDYP